MKNIISKDYYIEEKWHLLLEEEINKDYFKHIIKELDKEYASKTIYPEKENIFNAFNKTNFDDIKVVILGQDPYHQVNQAEGLAFSVRDNVKTPPSLKNIFKELATDLNINYPTTNSLCKWAEEGVFLLNSVLTVEESKPASHKHLKWETFTDLIIKKISDDKKNIVFILWGNFAQKKSTLIDESKHLIIKNVHPSPLSAYNGFWGSKPFSKTNKYLIAKKITPINWSLK